MRLRQTRNGSSYIYIKCEQICISVFLDIYNWSRNIPFIALPSSLADKNEIKYQNYILYFTVIYYQLHNYETKMFSIISYHTIVMNFSFMVCITTKREQKVVILTQLSRENSKAYVQNAHNVKAVGIIAR